MIDLLNGIAEQKLAAAASAKTDVEMTHVVMGGKPRPIRPGANLALGDTMVKPAMKRNGEADEATLPPAKMAAVSTSSIA